MRVLLRHTGPNGKTSPGCGEAFTGETALDVVFAMKAVSPFTAERYVDEHMETVLRDAGDLLGIELHTQGSTTYDRAESFISTLIEHGLAELQSEDEKPKTGGKKRCVD